MPGVWKPRTLPLWVWGQFTWILSYFHLPQCKYVSQSQSLHVGSPELLPGNKVGFIHQIKSRCGSRLHAYTVPASSKYCSDHRQRQSETSPWKSVLPQVFNSRDPEKLPNTHLYFHASQLEPKINHCWPFLFLLKKSDHRSNVFPILKIQRRINKKNNHP